MKQGFFLLITLILIFTNTEIFSQSLIVNDSVKRNYLNDLRIQDSIYKVKNDSLRKEFYSKPPYLTLNLEINKEKIRLSENFEFWVEVKGKKYFPIRVETDKFLSTCIADTMKIVFVYEQDSLIFENVAYRLIQHGAYFKFGIIENLEQIRSYYYENKKDEDFDEWAELGEPYLGLLKDKKLKRQKRKIGKIQFLGLYPRNYGDGMNFTFVHIKAR